MERNPYPSAETQSLNSRAVTDRPLYFATKLIRITCRFLQKDLSKINLRLVLRSHKTSRYIYPKMRELETETK